MQKGVAFQGVLGAYSEEAAHKYFGERSLTIPCRQFEDVFEIVRKGKCEFGIIPIENSLAGSIHQNYDLLLKYNLCIVGEEKLKIAHNLLGCQTATRKKIEKIYSHPQALMQCQNTIKDLGESHAFYDTAGSAAYIAQQNDPTIASIASLKAAQKYKLKVLKKNIHDFKNNYTRFLIIARASKKNTLEHHKSSTFMTSIVFSLKSIPGALHKALSIFAIREIDLLKIESRPNPSKTWEYLFYLDLAGHCESEVIVRSLDHLEEITHMIKVLGSYKPAKN